jgi:hypothetical protein
MEEAYHFETSVDFQRTIRRCISELRNYVFRVYESEAGHDNEDGSNDDDEG